MDDISNPAQVVIFHLISLIWLTCMGVYLSVCVCVWRLFAHGDKQLPCTWPKPRAKDGSSTWPHGAFSPATAQRITLTHRPPPYMCLPGHIFRAWHSSAHTCQHFLLLSSLFSWMLVIIVSNYLTVCCCNISVRSPLEPAAWLTWEVMERTRMERAKRQIWTHTDHRNWDLWQSVLFFVQTIVWILLQLDVVRRFSQI